MGQSTIAVMLSEGHDTLDWFKENLEFLRKKYDEQFIALKNQSVIASDPKLHVLLKRLKQEGYDMKRVLIRRMSKIKNIL